MHLIGETLADGITESIRYARDESYYIVASLVGEERAAIARREFERISRQFIPAAIQLILYLCAENAEVAENPEQKQITSVPPRSRIKHGRSELGM